MDEVKVTSSLLVRCHFGLAIICDFYLLTFLRFLNFAILVNSAKEAKKIEAQSNC